MSDTPQHPVDTLLHWMHDRAFVVLTGAGISTSSGIPDYRDSEGVRRGRASSAGVRAAQPNAAHEAIARLQRHGLISGVITQNVDALHDQAGSDDVVELHGSLHWVLCLDCRQRTERDIIQRTLVEQNPYLAGVDAVQAPDGDTLLDPVFEARFQVPHCPHCGGQRMKPDVVFFGENVAPATAAKAMQRVEEAPGLLVVGSSLMAFSAFRLCRAINDQGKPLIAINLGKTRADDLLDIKIEASCETLLPTLAERLIKG
jgi:NAD-dependent SIR2 family protein deacetylase